MIRRYLIVYEYGYEVVQASCRADAEAMARPDAVTGRLLDVEQDRMPDSVAGVIYPRRGFPCA